MCYYMGDFVVSSTNNSYMTTRLTQCEDMADAYKSFYEYILSVIDLLEENSKLKHIHVYLLSEDTYNAFKKSGVKEI